MSAVADLELVYPASDADLARPISEAFVDTIIRDAGSPREAVRQLLEGQRLMLKRERNIIAHSTSRGFDRCRLRPPGSEKTPASRVEPLDF